MASANDDRADLANWLYAKLTAPGSFVTLLGGAQYVYPAGEVPQTAALPPLFCTYALIDTRRDWAQARSVSLVHMLARVAVVRADVSDVDLDPLMDALDGAVTRYEPLAGGGWVDCYVDNWPQPTPDPADDRWWQRVAEVRALYQRPA